MVLSFEGNILGDYLSYVYSLLLWFPLSAFNLPDYGWKPIGILGVISYDFMTTKGTSNSKLLCAMCFLLLYLQMKQSMSTFNHESYTTFYTVYYYAGKRTPNWLY